MQSLCGVHERYGGRHGQGAGEPNVRIQELKTCHADNRRKDMAPNEIPRLRQRAFDGAVYQNGRRAERPYDHDQISPRELVVIEVGDRGYSKECSNPRPSDFGKAYPRRTFSVPLHFSEIVFHRDLFTFPKLPALCNLILEAPGLFQEPGDAA